MKPTYAIACLAVVAATNTWADQETKQEPPSQGYLFETQVRIVPVPVFVTDSDGDPVIDLSLEDFRVKEEGEVRPIELFDLIVYESSGGSPNEPGRPIHPGLRRQFLLLFDLTFTNPRGLIRARTAALDMIRTQLLPEDLVAVATYSTVGGLKMLVNFTTSHRHAELMVDTLGLIDSTQIVRDPLGFIFDITADTIHGLGSASQDFAPIQEHVFETVQFELERFQQQEDDAYRSQALQYVSQFSQLNEALRALTGRKTMILFSQGIASDFITGTGITRMDDDLMKIMAGETYKIDPENRFGRTDLRQALMEALEKAVSADTVIHTVDVSGLGGAADTQPGVGEGKGQDTLYLMANETGGRMFTNVNDLRRPLEGILREAGSFYLLGFEPQNLQHKGRFRRIEVEVERPGVKVSARSGYYEPAPPEELTDAERKLALAEYVSKDLISKDLSFETLITAHPGEGEVVRVPVFLKFPGKQFLDEKRKSKLLQIELFGYAMTEENEFIDFFAGNLSFDLDKERDRLSKTGFKYYNLLLAKPGRIRIKVLARDLETGKIGSVIEDIAVPDFSVKELALTSPVFATLEPNWIVARGLDPDHPEPRRRNMPIDYPFTTDGQEFIPAVCPHIRGDTTSHVVLRAYNLELHPQNKLPQTEMKFQRIAPDGSIETLHGVGLAKRPTQPYSNCFELIFQIQWNEVPEGSALFQISITDNLANETVSANVPYVLSR